MKKRICVHTMNIGNFFPELTELTLPTIEDYCRRINADFNIITERIYPEKYVLLEKLQVYEQGKDYDYNIFLDADILVHPDAYNPFNTYIPTATVAFKDNYHATNQLKSDIYFERDGRNVGISTCAVFTDKYTHELWKPLDMPLEQIKDNAIQDGKSKFWRVIDEYALSRNFARYGFKYIEPFPINEYNLIYHLGTYEENKEEIVNRAKLWLKTFWK